MSKFDTCLTSLNLRDSVPVDALQKVAAQYQAGGMEPAAAMLRAVEDQLTLAQMEEASIVKTVRAAWEAQGGAKKVPDLAPVPEPKPLDHGELNIPGRLNNIDRDLDRYKAEQEKTAKAESKTRTQQTREDKARAKELMSEHGAAMLDKYGPKFDRKELAKEFDSMVKWEPAKFIKLAETFAKEQQAAPAAEPKPAPVEEAPAPTSEPEPEPTAVPASERAPADVADELLDLTDQRTIEVDGQRRPIKDSRGKLVARDFAGQVAFWKWYGGGPVDDRGRPTAVYHATFRDFSEFRTGGELGAHFGTAEQANELAEEPGSRLMPVYVSIKKPLRLNDGGTFRAEKVVPQLIEAGILPAQAKPSDYLAADGIREDAEGTRKLQDAIKAAGFDGVIYENTNEGDGTSYIAFDPEQIKSAVGNSGAFDPNDASIVRDVSDRLPLMLGYVDPDDAPKRVATVAKIKAAKRRLEKGEITEKDFKFRIDLLLAELEARNASKVVTKERERGPEWVIERLMRARRTEELDRDTVNFALWALDKNPQLATDMGISLRTPNERGTAGMYNPASRVMTLFKGAENTGTAVHEILHHTERMLPPDVQAQVVKAWRKELARAYKGADDKTRAALDDMIVMAADKKAAERVVKSFGDGTLDYDTHCQLSNASEYWAVNATRIMGERFAADSWQAKAKQWLVELVQKARGWLGLKSYNAVLAGLKAVTEGTGERLSPRMLVEQAMARDIAPKQTETPAFKKWFGYSKVVDASGKPKVIYIGTKSDFHTFDDALSGSATGRGRGTGLGFWSTDNPAVSEIFANGEGGNIMPVFLSIESPYTLTNAAFTKLMMQTAPLDKNGQWEAMRAFRDDLIAKGHDGIYIPKQTKAALVAVPPQARGILKSVGLMIEPAPPGTEGDGGRWVAFKPEQIKSATGNSGAFDPADPSILRDITRPLPAATWTPPPMDRLDGIVHTMQDRFVDMKKVVKAIREQAGALEDKWNPYLQEELFHGRSATGFKTFLNDELRPLLSDMQMRGVGMDELQEYLHMRHAEEANEQIARVNPDMPDGGSGVDTQDARDYLAALAPAKARAYEALAGRVDAITKKTQALLVEYGLEKQETIDAWNATYQHYVPLMREDMDAVQMGTGTGSGFSTRGSASQRRMGSSRAVVDILANVAMARERTVVRGEKNRLDLALYGLALKAPNPEFWKPINPQKNPAALAAELVDMGLSPAMAQSVIDEPKQRVIDPRTGLVVKRVNTMLRSQPNVIAVRVAGEDRFIFFNERNERALRMAQSLKNIGIDTVEGFTAAIAVATRYFSAINTQYNPIFGIVNLVRDMGEGAINLSSTPIAGKQAAVLAETARLLGKAIKARGRLDQMTGADAALWEEFQAQGGTTGFRAMFSTSEDRSREIARELNPDQWMESKWGKIFTAGGKLKVPYSVARKVAAPLFDWLSDYNEALENITRMAVFKVARDNGVTVQQAASTAKGITVNFNRKGAVTSQIGAWYAFFNAAVQGTTRMIETLNGPAGRRIIAGGLMLGAVQAVLLAASGFDEEPPEFVKSRNFIIPLGSVSGKKNYITVPLPLGFNFIHNTGRLFTEYGLGGAKHTGRYITHMADVLMDTFNPIGNSGFSIQTVLPTVADPLAALAENRDFTGKEIYREDMSKLDPTPGYLRAKDTASAVGKAVSYYSNLWTGGTEYTPGQFSPTPDQIDYLLGQFTGGVGRELMKAQQSTSAAIAGEEVPAHKIPLAGRFYGEVDDKSGVGSAFYKNLLEANLHDAEVEGRAQDRKDVRGYLKEHPEAKLADMAQAVQRDVSALRKQKRELMERGASREKIRLLDERARGVMARFNERYEKAKQPAEAQ